MKKFLFLLFAILALVACSDDGIDQITIDTTLANFATAGGSTSITFASSGAWTAEVVNSGASVWCSVSPASGNAGNAEIRITATANTTTDDRTATVVIKTGTVEKSIAVSQKQKDALNVSSSAFEFSAEGGEFEIEVDHNIDFDVEIDGDWITLLQPRSLETSTLKFVVAENTASQAREGSVILTSADDTLSQTISVTQEAPRYEIIYTSSDGRVVTPYQSDVFGANIVSNVYENGKGVITFDGPITSIGGRAFYDRTSLTSVIIPDRVLSIGNNAFENCSNLNSAIIGDGVTVIGDLAFLDCYRLTSVTIPGSVAEIGDQAFYYCYSLTSVAIPESVTSIGIAAFNCCHALTSVTIPDSVTSIGNAAFGGANLASFYGKFASADNRCLIVDGVLNSFAPAGLTTYAIPNSVTSIGTAAFLGCTSLTGITIPDSVLSIGYNAFSNCSNLNSVTIGNGVTTIGEQAFYYCRSLNNLTIGNSVTTIEPYAFFHCEGLTNVVFPHGMTQIREYAFSYCTGLKSVTIPASVASIGKEAFANCYSLKSVYCKSTTPPTLGAYGFNTNSFGRKIYVPRGRGIVYKIANNWSIYADSIEEYYY